MRRQCSIAGAGDPSDQLPTQTMKIVTRSSGSFAAIIGEPGCSAPQLFAASPETKNIRCGCHPRRPSRGLHRHLCRGHRPRPLRCVLDHGPRAPPLLLAASMEVPMMSREGVWRAVQGVYMQRVRGCVMPASARRAGRGHFLPPVILTRDSPILHVFWRI